jgi:hypothetical protein
MGRGAQPRDERSASPLSRLEAHGWAKTAAGDETLELGDDADAWKRRLMFLTYASDGPLFMVDRPPYVYAIDGKA